jgi:hypothetical protein
MAASLIFYAFSQKEMPHVNIPPVKRETIERCYLKKERGI